MRRSRHQIKHHGLTGTMGKVRSERNIMRLGREVGVVEEPVTHGRLVSVDVDIVDRDVNSPVRCPV